MNRDPIFLRIDATPESGYERLTRCLTIAAALQRRRRPVYFLANLEPASLALTIKRGGNDWIPMHNRLGEPADLAQVQQAIMKHGPAAILVDDADVKRSYLSELVSTGTFVTSIDHIGAIRSPAHVIINPLLGPSRDSFEFMPYTQLLMGKRYAMVRPEIRRHRATRSQEPAPLMLPNTKTPANLFRALVALGDDDTNLQTLPLSKMLLGTPKIGKVDAIVRRDHPQLDELKALAAENADKFEIAIESAEITARLVRCHFAITSGSSWSLELACLGLPQLVLVQNEAHWPNTQRLEEEGCVSILGWHENTSAQTIRTGIQNLLADPAERQSMSRCGRKLIDGRGPDRLVNALEIMLAGGARRESIEIAA
ncbi:MAG: polysaccharide biosynthesis protein [Planctomycetota bacterium]|jgi:spore coat polysaccharide biosynthesis predicted glycosyltransferase SpsG